jgi:hypothetical protein
MRMIKSALLAAALMAVTSAANAAVIDLDTLVGWDTQDQEGVLGNFYDNSYTTALGTDARFTDLFVWGDEYEIYVNGVFQYSALVPGAAAAYEGDPEAAFASNLFTKGIVGLNPGDVLSFKALTLPQGYTDGTLAVSALAVPEPGSWAMMIAGFGLAGAAARRRRATAVTA